MPYSTIKYRPNKYTPELIKKAIKMRRQGYDVAAICIELGIEHSASVYYYTVPGRREKYCEYFKKWRRRQKQLLKTNNVTTNEENKSVEI